MAFKSTWGEAQDPGCLLLTNSGNSPFHRLPSKEFVGKQIGHIKFAARSCQFCHQKKWQNSPLWLVSGRTASALKLVFLEDFHDPGLTGVLQFSLYGVPRVVNVGTESPALA